MTVTPTTPADAAARRAEIHRAALQFEAMFLGLLVKSLRGTAGEGGLLAGGAGERAFRGLLDEEYGRALAGTTGIAELVEREIARAEGLAAYGREEDRWTGTRSFARPPRG